MRHHDILISLVIWGAVGCGGGGGSQLHSAHEASRSLKQAPEPEATSLIPRAHVLGEENFDADWRFHRGEADGAQEAAFDDKSWRSLDLPHDFSIEGPFDKNSPAGTDGASLNGGTGWYRKTFRLSTEGSPKIHEIRFDGVYMNSDVWLNGIYLGSHPYGYTSFGYDLSNYLTRDGSPNVLAVRVVSQQPNSRWYSGTGIYRHVWLMTRNLLHFEPLATRITTSQEDAPGATALIETVITNDSAKEEHISLVSTIRPVQGGDPVRQNSQVTVPAHSQVKVQQQHHLEKAALWSPASPSLYAMTISALGDNRTFDTFVTPFGVRTLRFTADQGFFLNGQHLKIQGVCMHHDLGALGSALNHRALERQLEILKAMGANAIRTSHNPPAPELLDLCDRMGFLVMDEAFDTWRTGKVTNDYHLYFDEWARSDVKSMVRRDRNHPSVIMWSIGNEIPDSDKSAGIAIAKQLIEWVREEDTTRPITMAENKMGSTQARTIAGLLDLVGYNYSPWRFDADHKEHPTWKIFGSETSSAVRSRGVYHTPADRNILFHEDMQCSSYDNSVVLWGDSAESSWLIDRERPFVLGEFIWTGFDYLGEPTPYPWPAKSSYFGIVDTAGFPKDIYYFYQSQWTNAPMVHILPHWNWAEGASVPVFVYANTPAVELLLNGRSLGQKSFGPSDTHLRWDVPFTAGTLTALAKTSGVSVAVDAITTAATPSAIALSADRTVIHADGKDLAFITATIIDKNGVPVPGTDHKVFFEAQGEGRVIAVDNGNPISHEPYQASWRNAFSSKALAIVQSTGKTGEILVSAASPEGAPNLAEGKPALSDSAEEAKGHTADKAVDGNPQTRWCAADEKAGHFWQVDLGTAQVIAASKIVWEKEGIVYRYVIDTSLDGKDWHRAVDESAGHMAIATHWHRWNAVARFVRVTVTELEAGAWASFWEFRLFGSLQPLASNPVVITAAPRN